MSNEAKSDADAARRFDARTAELGLNLLPGDREVLLAGWLGLQPQLARVRRGLTRDDRPPRPPRDRADGPR